MEEVSWGLGREDSMALRGCEDARLSAETAVLYTPAPAPRVDLVGAWVLSSDFAEPYLDPRLMEAISRA